MFYHIQVSTSRPWPGVLAPGPRHVGTDPRHDAPRSSLPPSALAQNADPVLFSQFFFCSQLLAKKGPRGSVWIAAHHDKRLKRSQVFETQISNTIDSIITPEVPLALRLSGQLMLGIVRIYAKKVGYLFQDCSDSFGRMKQGGKGQQQDNVNLPRDALQSSVQAITLPEIEQDPDFTQDPEAVGLGGGLSLPGTPISLAGSLAGTPEVLRRASVGSDGLRKSLSFESPAQSPYNSVDVDMMYTDEQFGDQGLEFELEPERLRSEDLAAKADGSAILFAERGGREPGHRLDGVVGVHGDLDAVVVAVQLRAPHPVLPSLRLDGVSRRGPVVPSIAKRG